MNVAIAEHMFALTELHIAGRRTENSVSYVGPLREVLVDRLLLFRHHVIGYMKNWFQTVWLMISAFSQGCQIANKIVERFRRRKMITKDWRMKTRDKVKIQLMPLEHFHAFQDTSHLAARIFHGTRPGFKSRFTGHGGQWPFEMKWLCGI